MANERDSSAYSKQANSQSPGCLSLRAPVIDIPIISIRLKGARQSAFLLACGWKRVNGRLGALWASPRRCVPRDGELTGTRAAWRYAHKAFPVGGRGYRADEGLFHSLVNRPCLFGTTDAAFSPGTSLVTPPIFSIPARAGI